MLNGEDTLVKCLDDVPEEKKAFLESFKVLAEIHKGLFNEDATEEDSEAVAEKCEYFLENYPIWFPEVDI